MSSAALVRFGATTMPVNATRTSIAARAILTLTIRSVLVIQASSAAVMHPTLTTTSPTQISVNATHAMSAAQETTI